MLERYLRTLKLLDLEYVEKIKRNEDVSQSILELKNIHSGIFYKFINSISEKRRSSEWLPYADMELLYGSCELVIYNSAMSFDPNRGMKFSTFFGDQTRFFVLNSLRKDNRQSPVVERESEFYFDTPDKEVLRKEKIKLIKENLKFLNDPISKRMVELKIFSEKSPTFHFISERIKKEFNRSYTEWGCNLKVRRAIKKLQSIISEIDV